MKKTLVISLGGSIIAPKPGFIDIAFIRKFRRLVLGYIQRERRQVIIVTGGGKLNKEYNRAVKEIVRPQPIDLDRLGIAATRFHAEFLRVIFGKQAYQEVLLNPTKRIHTNRPVICAAGWKPGCSTDKDAVLLAKTYRSRSVLNLTNIDFVYTKDPTRFAKAKKITDTTWSVYRNIIPKKWSPRLSTPFDPVASRLAQQERLTVVIINGRKIQEISRFMTNRTFQGTIIHP